MIENETRARAGVDQLGGVEQFSRPHAQVEAHTQFAQQTDAFLERVAEAEAGGYVLVVQHLANALDVRAALEASDVRLKAVRRGPAGDDRRDHRRLTLLAD